MAESKDDLRAVPPAPATKTNLDIVNDCDSFPYPDNDPEGCAAHIYSYYHLFIPPCPSALGYLLPSVALILKGIPGWSVNEVERTLTLDTPVLPTPDKCTLHDVERDAEDVSTRPNATTLEHARTEIFARTTAAMRSTDHFEVLRKWRNELYPIYWKDPNTEQQSVLASVERSASPLFGIVTYGAHMTAYVRDQKEGLKIWVGKRAATKQTYGGMLDQTVAGGIATGETARESIIRESEEEAGLPAELVERKAVATGIVSYFHIRDSRAGGETRLLMPECQFTYDLDLTGEDVVPKPDLDEVSEFQLLNVREVQEALGRGEFKPNCALVVLDFLIRHGIVTRENEKDYSEIVTRLRRRLEFPVL